MFDIRNYIGDKLELLKEIPSQYTVRCPVCNGKIQIKKQNGAYFCVTGWCRPNDIRPLLGESISKYSTNIINDFYKPSFSNFNIEDLKIEKKNIDYKLRQENFYSNVYKENVLASHYYYDSTHKLYRLDLLESKEKCVFPNYFDIFTNNWKTGVDSNSLFPWYNHEFISSDDKVFTIVEGEKTAHITTSTGLIALTPPLGFGWSEDYLKRELMRYAGRVKGFLLIPDNDETGMNKMLKFAKVCDKMSIQTQLLDLKNYYLKKGDDLADLIERGYNIIDLIKSELENAKK